MLGDVVLAGRLASKLVGLFTLDGVTICFVDADIGSLCDGATVLADIRR